MTCNDQIRVIGISLTSDMYHFFVLGTFKILSPSYFDNIQLSSIVTLLCYKTLEIIPSIQALPYQ
jgi:hypothetical protein